MKRITIYAKDREKQFSNDFIYLSFYSNQGVSIEVFSKFQEESKEDELKRQKEKEMQDKDTDILFKLCEPEPIREDFLINNINLLKGWKQH